MSVPASLHDLCFQLCVEFFWPIWFFCYCSHELLDICMSLIAFACVCVWLSVQPPAESVQDSGQCVDAPCEDAPPPIAAITPSPAPEPTPATVPPTDITLSVPVPALALSTSPDLPQTDGLSALLALGDSGAEGGASQGMATSAPGQAETPMAVVKLESVLDPTELSTVSAERWRSRRRGGLNGGA